MEIGVLTVTNKNSLDEALSGGYDMILAESNAGNTIGLGASQQIHFNFNKAEQKISLRDALEKLGWTPKPWGPKSFVLIGVPQEVAKEYLKQIYPGVKFTTVA